jgi:hypothetical protein
VEEKKAVKETVTHRSAWGPAPSPSDTVGANKKTSTPSTSDRSTKTKTTNLNLAQGTKVDALRTATSYFDMGWNAFA